jgi:hypothetical protein
MGNFFEGWRRKLGVLTLLMACVFAAGWVRSFRFSEWLAFPSGTNRGEMLGWLDCHVIWCTGLNLKAEDMEDLPTWSSEDFQSLDNFVNGASTMEKREFGGFVWINDPEDVSALIVPFWSIVIPLTLVSAYLLLSKPRYTKSILASETSTP